MIAVLISLGECGEWLRKDLLAKSGYQPVWFHSGLQTEYAVNFCGIFGLLLGLF